MKTLILYPNQDSGAETRGLHPHQGTFSKTSLGFWIYLMTDCLLFATLFTVYAVLHRNTFGGPSSNQLFDLSTAFLETMLLLLSSVTCGWGVLSSIKSKKGAVIAWLSVTCLLGVSFIGLELREFAHLIEGGNSWQRSGFLSSFFGLVGTHGLHVFLGLVWLLVMIAQIAFFGITADTFRRLAIFSLFWHFLDVVWIFIFTFVYLLGST